MSRTAASRNWRAGVAARRLVGAGAALVVLAACSSDGGDSSTVLDPQAAGLVLVDCWHDVAYQLDADDATLGRKGAVFAKPDSAVSPTDDCRTDSSYGPGINATSADGGKRGAIKSFSDDGARHAGYIDVGSGAFTDLSDRLKLDAFGELTDEGSGADDFAGPILDTMIGFGTDGRFYLKRADSVFAADGPEYQQFVKLEADPMLGVRYQAGGRLAAVGFADAPLVEVSADAPLVEPYQGANAQYLGEDARYAPMIFDPADADQMPSYCADLQWIDPTHLLCSGNDGTPGVVDFTEPTLARASAYAESRGCGDCSGREYIWVMPQGAYRTLVPKTQRELSGFAIEPSTGHVLFLATDGDDIRLYAVGPGRGATPEVRGEFSLGDDMPPGVDYLSLRYR